MDILSSENQIKKQMVELSPDHPLYPKQWLCFKAPPTCYAIGNLRLLTERKFAVVGSRRTSAQVMKIGASIAEEISSLFVIVTGTADGGDTAAIQGGLQTGKVICVLAGGFGHLPQGNLPLLERVAKEGLLLSPHPYDTEVRCFSYGYRNQLLAALSEGVLLLSAGEKSGALLTAEYAKAQNKKLFALPYAPNAAAGVGCNALIKQGAFLTECAQDIAEKFRLDLTKKKASIPLSEEENKIYGCLRELSEGHVTEIAERSGIAFFKVRAVLSALEIKGLVVALGGNCYAVV